MANYSVQVNQGWCLRITSGQYAGKEVALPCGRHVLGSQPPSSLLVNEAGVAGEHVAIDLTPTSATIKDLSSRGFVVNGQTLRQTSVKSGEVVQIAAFTFSLVNPALAQIAPAPQALIANPIVGRFLKTSAAVQVSLVVLLIAVVLYFLVVTTGNVNLIPAALVAMSAVVPSGVMTYLVNTYDKTGISFRTLAVTFLLGGSVGLISTIISTQLASALTFGLLSQPIFAGLFEEPAKLLATGWRWAHPVYDRPMDGLIIGAASGFGFAVFETAGYGLTGLLHSGLLPTAEIMVERGLLSPFGHGVWTAIVSAAFWQCGRNVGTAIRDRKFQMAALSAICLHGLWDSGFLGLVGTALSAYLSYRAIHSLLANNGYRR